MSGAQIQIDGIIFQYGRVVGEDGLLEIQTARWRMRGR